MRARGRAGRGGGARRAGRVRRLAARPARQRRARAATRGWAGRCGRRGCGTPSTPSCRPPRCWPGPGTTSTGSARELRAAAAELVGGPADRRDGPPGAGQARRRAPRRRHDRRPGQGDHGRGDRLRPRARPGDPGRRPVRDRGDAGVRPRRRGGLLRPARPAGDRRRADLLLHRADPGRLAGGAGRVVLPRVQRPHDPQPDRARGDARPLPAARPLPPVPRPRPGCARSAGPARSSRAGRSTPRS